jgi:hypothetical protein
MIRTLIAITAFAAAVTGVANAAEVRVSLVGKTDAVLRAELSQAAKAACVDVDVTDYAPCVSEAYHKAILQLIKVRAPAAN